MFPPKARLNVEGEPVPDPKPLLAVAKSPPSVQVDPSQPSVFPTKFAAVGPAPPNTTAAVLVPDPLKLYLAKFKSDLLQSN